MGYSFGSESKVIKKEELTLEEFKSTLRELCDEDYNGNNGEDYFTTVTDSNGVNFKISHFDYAWGKAICDIDSDDIDMSKLANIAKSILIDNYDDGGYYYSDYSVDVFDTIDSIIIVVSYMSHC